jgi:hypothetical protein
MNEKIEIIIIVKIAAGFKALIIERRYWFGYGR